MLAAGLDSDTHNKVDFPLLVWVLDHYVDNTVSL
jgi:hypothetical protein